MVPLYLVDQSIPVLQCYLTTLVQSELIAGSYACHVEIYTVVHGLKALYNVEDLRVVSHCQGVLLQSFTYHKNKTNIYVVSEP